jgi:methyltransferase (TIGR00027 family)
MTRTDDDTWDLASSVGATATMVAAARAVATKAADPLINDPYAEPLVRAVGIDAFTRLISGEVDKADADDPVLNRRQMAEQVAVRTRFFDEFFDDAGKAGIRQAVILASGLDARAYRLAWPAGMTVYEIDQPQVIGFKSATLAALGAVPTTHRRAVGIDLRQDWPTALQQAGFDASQPTAWIAEGLLLGYLPPDAQDRLLDNLTALSAPGSRFATESMPNINQLDEGKIQERMQTLTKSWHDHGFDIDMAELIYPGDRNEVAAYLDTHGWQTLASSTAELFAANGLPPITDDDDDIQAEFANLAYITATRKG